MSDLGLMSVALMSRAWQVPGLTPIEQLVLLALAGVADNDGGLLAESLPAVAAKCRISGAEARRAMTGLCARGYLVVAERASGIGFVLSLDGSRS